MIMSYYMRFLSTDLQATTAAHLEAAFRAVDPDYDVQVEDNEAVVRHAAATIAKLEINELGDGLFDEEREELTARVTAAAGDAAAKARVLEALRGARTIVVAQVLYGTGDQETTLAKLDPLWAWLFRNRRGLLQAEGEGYYDHQGLIFMV
jgi:hypothetical protein